MDPARFDRLTVSLATRPLTRRRTLAAGTALLGSLISAARGAGAQPPTPAASPAANVPPELAADNGTLFVQTASGGTMAPNPAAGQPLTASTGGTPATGTPIEGGTPVAAQHGAYLLTLHGHNGETIGFSDRPQRDFGEVPTPRFFTGLGFAPTNPPNAALVVDTPHQQGAVVLVELLNPAYASDTHTLTYEANLLHQYPNAKSDGMAALAAKAEATVPASFTNVSLFIDDCPNSTETCWTVGSQGFCGNMGNITSGNCWSWGLASCNPCGSYASLCNQAFPACNNNCLDDIALCSNPGCCLGQCCPNPACFGTTPQAFYCPPSDYCTAQCP